MTAVQDSTGIRYTGREEFEPFRSITEGYIAESITPYWTWKRLTMFVLTMRSGRSPTLGEWQALHREIPTLSVSKKTWLYRQMKSYFSPEAMQYLFGGWRPPSPTVDLDLWL
jgi:hypothetical protein